MIKDNAEALKKDRSQPQWVYTQGGQRTVSTLKAMEKICAEDQDYKEEIANLTEITVTSKSSYSDYKSKLTLNGTILNIDTGHRMTRRPADFIKPIKELY